MLWALVCSDFKYNLVKIFQNECSKSWYNTFCSATAKLKYMSECLGDRLEYSISVYELEVESKKYVSKFSDNDKYTTSGPLPGRNSQLNIQQWLTRKPGFPIAIGTNQPNDLDKLIWLLENKPRNISVKLLPKYLVLTQQLMAISTFFCYKTTET